MQVGALKMCNLLSTLGCIFVETHNTVEDAARCAAAKNCVCSSAAATLSYATAEFVGVGVTPAFTYAAAARDHHFRQSRDG